MKMGLVRKLFGKIYRVEKSDLVRFETRRIKPNEKVFESKTSGLIDDQWVWSIKPVNALNPSQIRNNTILDEINDTQIPELEKDKSGFFQSVIGTYHREKIYLFNKLKHDRVIIEPFKFYR